MESETHDGVGLAAMAVVVAVIAVPLGVLAWLADFAALAWAAVAAVVVAVVMAVVGFLRWRADVGR